MEQQNGRDGWYDTSSDTGWYSAPQPQKPDWNEPPKKHKGMKITMIVVCALILIAAAVYAIAGSVERKGLTPSAEQTPSAGEPDETPGSDYGGDFRDYFDNYYQTDDTTEPSNIQRAENVSGVSLEIKSSDGLDDLSLQDVYSKCIDSVVGIKATTDGYDGYYWGTGIIMTEDGYILTNAHVISGTDAATVTTSDGTSYDAQLVGEDTQSDIAVLKIDASGLQAAEFGDSDELSVGDEVVAIGDPLGSELSGTMTNGIVSAINRGITVGGHEMTLLQTNAALNEGNSGGPLINMYGQVVGITNMKMVADYSSDAAVEGIGFAIPTATMKGIVGELIEKGAISGRPGIGITVGAIPSDAASHYDLPDGLYISDVVKSSDAYAKGIRPGDILTAVNGTAVTSTEEVNAIKDKCSVGDTLTLTLYRDGKTFDADVELYDVNDLF